jgi:hypothetical protein
VKRSSLVKLAAICALWISSSSVLQAQRAWEVSIGFSGYNTFYEEDFMSKIREDEIMSYPQDLRGNSLTALALNPSITYRARREQQLPFFLTLEGQIPIVVLRNLETGHKYKEVAYLVQREDVEHRSYAGCATLGWEMLPWLQPCLMFEYNVFTTRRIDQLNGTDSGTLVPEADNDYTETAKSTQFGIGVEGYIPLAENSLTRIRYQIGYHIPQYSSVDNDLDGFGAISTGQGTSGYTIGGKVQVDLPLASMNDSYLSFGGRAQKRYWNGDGGSAKGTGRWPANFAIEAGGFIGVGMFF